MGRASAVVSAVVCRPGPVAKVNAVILAVDNGLDGHDPAAGGRTRQAGPMRARGQGGRLRIAIHRDPWQRGDPSQAEHHTHPGAGPLPIIDSLDVARRTVRPSRTQLPAAGRGPIRDRDCSCGCRSTHKTAASTVNNCRRIPRRARRSPLQIARARARTRTYRVTGVSAGATPGLMTLPRP